jgi:hypothetical protein
MPIYDKPVRVLIRNMISTLAPKLGQPFSKDSAIEWFAQNYPKIKEGTISAHLIRFSTNAPSRLHYSVKADEDLLFQLDGSHFRLYNAATDPAPIHSKSDVTASQEKFIEPSEVQSPSEFAYETDLRDFLAKNLSPSSPAFNSIKTKALPALSFPLGAGSLTYSPWMPNGVSWLSNLRCLAATTALLGNFFATCPGSKSITPNPANVSGA